MDLLRSKVNVHVLRTPELPGVAGLMEERRAKARGHVWALMFFCKIYLIFFAKKSFTKITSHPKTLGRVWDEMLFSQSLAGLHPLTRGT